MEWTFGAPLSADHRAQLIAAGATTDAVDATELREASGPLPDWWTANGNTLYATGELALSQWVIDRLTGFPFHGSLIAIASDCRNLVSLLAGGTGAVIFLGPNTELTAGEIYCGAGSSVIINGETTATRCAMIDARNGGTIVAQADQLWAGNAYIATDDMHRLEDLATGSRINSFGAHIRLGRHVWIGRDAVVTGHVEIGEGCVVGARSLVRGQKVPPHTAVAGTPARVIRENITWNGDDLP